MGLLLVLFWLLLQFLSVLFCTISNLCKFLFDVVSIRTQPYWRIGLIYVQSLFLNTSIVLPQFLPANLYSIVELFSTLSTILLMCSVHFNYLSDITPRHLVFLLLLIFSLFNCRQLGGPMYLGVWFQFPDTDNQGLDFDDLKIL